MTGKDLEGSGHVLMAYCLRIYVEELLGKPQDSQCPGKYSNPTPVHS
jgi:hypothetical protein